MKNDPLAYPNTLKYFQFYKDFDLQTGSPKIEYLESHTWMEANANNILNLITRDNPPWHYLNNRLREKISCFIFSGIMRTGIPHQSSVANDILCKVDAICWVGLRWVKKSVAIDFTGNRKLVGTKLENTDSEGNIKIIWTNGNRVNISLLVVTIDPEMVSTVLSQTEEVICKNQSIDLRNLREKIKRFSKTFLTHQKSPEDFFDIHFHSNARWVIYEHMAYQYAHKMTKYRNPQPSR